MRIEMSGRIRKQLDQYWYSPPPSDANRHAVADDEQRGARDNPICRRETPDVMGQGRWFLGVVHITTRF
jgi:hypothetical protein